jgi:hypothetical protein
MIFEVAGYSRKCFERHSQVVVLASYLIVGYHAGDLRIRMTYSHRGWHVLRGGWPAGCENCCSLPAITSESLCLRAFAT